MLLSFALCFTLFFKGIVRDFSQSSKYLSLDLFVLCTISAVQFSRTASPPLFCGGIFIIPRPRPVVKRFFEKNKNFFRLPACRLPPARFRLASASFPRPSHGRFPRKPMNYTHLTPVCQGLFLSLLKIFCGTEFPRRKISAIFRHKYPVSDRIKYIRGTFCDSDSAVGYQFISAF